MPIDYPGAEALQVLEIVKSVEDSLTVTTEVSRWTHAVEEQRILAYCFIGIILMPPRFNTKVRQATPLELCKKQPKPVRVLVVDGHWFCFKGHAVSSIA